MRPAINVIFRLGSRSCKHIGLWSVSGFVLGSLSLAPSPSHAAYCASKYRMALGNGKNLGNYQALTDSDRKTDGLSLLAKQVPSAIPSSGWLFGTAIYGLDWAGRAPTDTGAHAGGDAATLSLQNCGELDADSVSRGIFAVSQGGDGEAGANATTTHSSRIGAAGGDGGTMWIDHGGRGKNEIANIELTADGAIGIYALSQGGKGGDGGSGATLFHPNGSHGGLGGNGGSIHINVSGAVTTLGHRSPAVWARSEGASGGPGGDSAEFIGSGGDGGTAGNGGSKISVTQRGDISTQGSGSAGVVMQSIGGQGGSGGDAKGTIYTVGGSGSVGGDGGAIDYTIPTLDCVGCATTHLSTSGDQSPGVMALSIGGGGGDGGDTTEVSLFGGYTVGGSAIGGGKGGTVDFQLEAGSAIQTAGRHSPALIASSIGGGGGHGGRPEGFSVGAYADFQASVGGHGGAGGDGGSVNVNIGYETPIGTGIGSESGDHSAAVVAQSVGGGGGMGGNSLAFAAAVGGKGAASVSTSIGGSGGSAGDGGKIDLQNMGYITTNGRMADGLYASSVGGGGGRGGNSISIAAAAAKASASVSVGVGGQGKSGGHGGDVSVTSTGVTGNGSIATDASGATGIHAQSVGGGGGSGGSVTDAALAAGTKGALPISVGVGGAASKGGRGGSVDVTLGSGTGVSYLHTRGHHAPGILAQSIGGGGGTGGSVHSYSLALSKAKGRSIAPSIAVGGTGGAGGDGGLATVTNEGRLTSTGDQSAGILAQSVGGGGGFGGHVSELSLAASTGSGEKDSSNQESQQIAVSVGVGGSGGDGGSGGKTSISNHGSGHITTLGTQSPAIHAQSIGGGGGIGGTANSVAKTKEKLSPTDIFGDTGGDEKLKSAWEGFKARVSEWQKKRNQTNEKKKAANSSVSASVGVGGSGGSGGSGGIASISHSATGAVSTFGNHSHALYAQAIGGGGGHAGLGNADGMAGVGSYGLSLGIGGYGGAAGDGGLAKVTTTDGAGTVQTNGDLAFGVFAQSIGGGGGQGGAAQSRLTTIPTKTKRTATISIGGKGGAQGNGGAVTVKNDSAIDTFGFGATAIMAQSVGGGGGAGGHSLGDSILNFALGGAGGAAGDGGQVTVDGNGAVRTAGDAAPGIHAQSIGGGGGHGGAAGAKDAESHDLPQIGLSVAMGGDGGAGGDGGTINVSHGGKVSTYGDVSPGIIAQSIGGGGGSFAAGELTVGIGASPTISSNGDSGSAGRVSVQDSASNPMAIHTTGAGSAGIIAQSVGAGGGLVLLPVDLDSIQPDITHDNASAGGQSGGILVDLHGDVVTQGDSAYGILALSQNAYVGILGTNGLVSHDIPPSVNSGQRSNTTLKINDGAQVETHGKGADAIRVEASGTSDDAITINIDGGVAASGTDAWAIRTRNTIGNDAAGSATTTRITVGDLGVVDAGAHSAGAISVTDTLGQAAVSVKGTVYAGKGVAVSSSASGTIDVSGNLTGDVTSTEGAKLALSNSGQITGSVTGKSLSYRIHPSGTHYLRLDPRARSIEKLNVSKLSPSADSIAPKLTTIPEGGAQDLSLTLARTDHITFSASASDPVASVLSSLRDHTAATRYNYSLRNLSSGEPVELIVDDVSVDFDRVGGTGNNASLAKLANASLTGLKTGSPLDGTLVDAANATTASSVWVHLSALDASSHYAATNGAATSASTHLGNMQSCGDPTSAYSAIAQANCHWAKGTLFSRRNAGHHETGQIISMGRQQQVADTVFAGLSGGWEFNSHDSDTGGSRDGYRFFGGGILKYQEGPVFGSAALGLTYSWGDATRVASNSLGTSTANADQRTLGASTRFTGGYLADLERFDLIPRLDVDLSAIHDFGYRERGADNLNIAVDSNTNFLLDVHPALRINKVVEDSEEKLIQMFAEVGARYSPWDPSLHISLPDGPNPSYHIDLTSDREDLLTTVAAGIRVTSYDGLETRVEYEGGFGDRTENHAVSVKLGLRF